MAPSQRKFTLTCAVSANRGVKRDAESSPAPPRPAIVPKTSVPKAAQLTIEANAPRPHRTTRMPGSAPVIMTIYKVTDKASEVWNMLEGADAAIFQVQIKHEARPSVAFDIVGSFNDFLKSAHADNEEIPPSLTELTRDGGIKLILTNTEDPDNVGCFVQWRVAFYVAGADGSLKNFMLLIDDFFKFKEQQMAREHPFEVHVYPHIGITLSEDDLEYEHYKFNEPAKSLPLKIFEAHPCAGKRIITLHIEVQSDNIISLLFAGNTWQYRVSLEDRGVLGAYFGDKDEKKYFRVLKDVDASDETQKQRVVGMFSDVFHNMAMRVFVEKDPETQSHASAIIDELRELSCLRFE